MDIKFLEYFFNEPFAGIPRYEVSSHDEFYEFIKSRITKEDYEEFESLLGLCISDFRIISFSQGFKAGIKFVDSVPPVI